MPQISVVIPAYNYARFLPDCIDSVLHQRDVDREIVVIDDGSTDDTGAVVAAYGDRVRYVYQANAGLSAARNTGIRESRGRYLTFLDADDRLGPQALSGRVAAIENDGGSGAAVCRTRIEYSSQRGASVNVRRRWPLFHHDLDVHLCRLNIAPPHAFMLSRDVVERVGGFDETLGGCEDYDYWLRVCASGCVPVRAVGGHVVYRVHGDSMGAAKARRAAFPFDVMVHDRKASGNYGDCFARLVDSPPGSLALVDGLLHTAAAIDRDANADGRARLVVLATTYLRRLDETLPPRHRALSLAARLYLERVATRGREIGVLGDAGLREAWDAVRQRYAWPRRALANLASSLPPRCFEHAALASATLRNAKPGRST